MMTDRNAHPFEDERTLTYEEAVLEARRCLQCKHKPCVEGCVAHMEIPDMIRLFLEVKGELARQTAVEGDCFPQICGRVCYQEIQCELKCVRNKTLQPVKIGRLERYIGDTYVNETVIIKEPYLGKVAVIGSGPAGLAATHDLLKANIKVDVYEKRDYFGGVLRYGIPQFRLPNQVVRDELSRLEASGATFLKDQNLSKTFKLADLFDRGYDAVFIGVGAAADNYLNIEGVRLPKVVSWKKFMEISNLYEEPMKHALFRDVQTIACIGGGNVAMDVVRSAKRLGMQADLIYRRNIEQMPARKEEIEVALEEGVVFHPLRDPVAVSRREDDKVELRCIVTELKFDADNPRGIIGQTDQTEILLCDMVVMAVGSSVKSLHEEGLLTDAYHRIVVDTSQKTSLDKVYAGGDAVTGSLTVIHALKTGKNAAQSIIQQLKNSL
jgi:glutamate synthase (NADPH/NADH) small chain